MDAGNLNVDVIATPDGWTITLSTTQGVVLDTTAIPNPDLRFLVGVKVAELGAARCQEWAAAVEFATRHILGPQTVEVNPATFAGCDEPGGLDTVRVVTRAMNRICEVAASAAGDDPRSVVYSLRLHPAPQDWRPGPGVGNYLASIELRALVRVGESEARERHAFHARLLDAAEAWWRGVSPQHHANLRVVMNDERVDDGLFDGARAEWEARTPWLAGV